MPLAFCYRMAKNGIKLYKMLKSFVPEQQLEETGILAGSGTESTCLDRQIDRQIDIQIERQIYKQIKRQIDSMLLL